MVSPALSGLQEGGRETLPEVSSIWAGLAEKPEGGKTLRWSWVQAEQGAPARGAKWSQGCAVPLPARLRPSAARCHLPGRVE